MTHNRLPHFVINQQIKNICSAIFQFGKFQKQFLQKPAPRTFPGNAARAYASRFMTEGRPPGELPNELQTSIRRAGNDIIFKDKKPSPEIVEASVISFQRLLVDFMKECHPTVFEEFRCQVCPSVMGPLHITALQIIEGRAIFGTGDGEVTNSDTDDEKDSSSSKRGSGTDEKNVDKSDDDE